MNKASGLSVTKPASVWNKAKSIKADFRELFKSLGKAGIDGFLGKWEEVAKDIVEASASLGLAEAPEEIAWVLIYRALIQAMIDLLAGNQELLINPAIFEDLEVICNYRLDLSLEQTDVKIDQQFFQNPKKLAILESIKIPFSQLLESLGVSKAESATISHRLPTYFVYALHQEWAKHPEKYACLKEEVDTPFTQANQREQAWQIYFAWLQKQVEEPMFLEAFGLKQVFVPLNAYYLRKLEGKQDDDFEFRGRGEKREERVVLDLETELEIWLKQAQKTDAIRVISGGPGSGKSSFAKIFAAKQAEKGEIPVLFVPLHHFDPSDNLVDAVGKFVRIDPDGILPPNPLAEENIESRLLIIFDGLDELAMHGKVGTEVAQNFVREVQRRVDRFNQQKTRLMVIISGRELVVQANSTDFRQPKQILHILPYFVSKEERKNYVDDAKLSEQDKRQIWWQLYGKTKGFDYAGLPDELNKNNITEITSQPLLNYLVALSRGKGEVEFTEDSNLNVIYNKLLKAVYERAWDCSKHSSLQGITEEQFVRFLEAIALASWHGDGRTTTVKEIESHCENSGLKNLLDIFQEGAKAGVTRLLTAFYFRQSGEKQDENTFEFTHKSFGEYLTAKRIVREVRLIQEELEARKKNFDKRSNEQEALKRWAILCGASPMDEYIFNFVFGEMRLQAQTDVEKWQQTLCHLIGFMLRHGMPMEKLDPRPSFQEENRQARNAEEALLVVLNACARVTEKLSEIKWDSPEAFGSWISRLSGQRVGRDIFCLNYLSFLDLQNCNLIYKDLCRANFERANLVGANLLRANLGLANLVGADLLRANLGLANLYGANLERANLVGADLGGANLERANLVGADLEGANLGWANLKGANLVGANLVGARLSHVNLPQVNLPQVNLQQVNLEWASLEGANLEGANLEGANLEGANLEGANLKGANLERANLEWASLEWASLVGANLEQASLTEANLERANLKGAKNLDTDNLKGTILEGKDLSSLIQDSDSNVGN
ncbi:pentapeptide repeat-containing protein [Calothrix sp. PCC 6303]|uniref:pentapeptide repeat-containing protein n=1 Tax=Calothrix sp. PCC 6303 TaxID=1170562 RepID=UPI0002A01C9E|nr:pentapeptide repeat-containing protein [Calothrix sp. PCC 6303]AFY99639.1 pentapeptide repeat protein [Calothrix sp. PCC 6303]